MTRRPTRWSAESARCSRPARTSSAPAAAPPLNTSPHFERQWTVMKQKVCDVNPAALEKLPEATGDKSGIGVHYVDAWIKPMNVKLEDGTAVKCKRRGLKITLQAGAKKGDGLMRRLANGPDPAAMLDAALKEAASNAGLQLTVEDGVVYLEV